MTLGELIWKIKGDTKDVDKKLKDTNSEVDSSATKFGKLQGIVSKAAPWVAAGAAVIAVGKKILDLGVRAGNAADKLLDLTEITGLNTDTLQELQFIAADAGVNFDGLTGAVTKFTAKIPQIENGTGDVADAFNKLGVNLRDANGEIRSQDDLFPDLLKSLQNVTNTTERNAIAQQLFGRSLNDLAPVLGLTNDEFDALRDKADEAGSVISGDALEAANEFRKELDTAKLSVDQAKIALGTQFAPVLSEVVIPIVETAANIINTLATAVGKLNDLLSEPNDRQDQIGREIDFLRNQIEKTKTLNMLGEDQKQLLIDNYNTRITQLQYELRGLALEQEGQNLVNEEKQKQIESTEEQISVTEEETEKVEELADAEKELNNEIDRGALIVEKWRNKSNTAWDEFLANQAEAKRLQEDINTITVDYDALSEQALTSALGGFIDLGQAIYDGADAYQTFGAAALSALSEVLKALGAQLAAEAAVALLGGNIAGAIAGGAASAAAYTAAGFIGAAASDISSSAASTVAPPSSSGSSGGSPETPAPSRGSGGGGDTRIVTEVYLDGKKIATATAPYLISELERRGDM